MKMSITNRFKNAWNAFNDNVYNNVYDETVVYSSYVRPDRVVLTRGHERSIITSVINRIAMDVASMDLTHCRLDENSRFDSEINSSLNNCLTLEANIDQNAKAFIQDVVMTMFDKGCVAIVPVDTNVNLNDSSSFDILTMRTGEIVQWNPQTVKIKCYNDRKGIKEEITMDKAKVGIIENPFYAIMNEHNSTLQRLNRKLVLLDSIDEQSGSGKLDLIIQLPYTIRSESRRDQANKRRAEIERQLAGSKYGIAYTDGTEKITQLNRPVENNLMKQIEYLTSMLYSQLGITQTILDGTADEKTMLNYYSRTIEPIITSIALELKRKFLSKTARSQGQSILFFRDPFKLVPINNIADIADKFTRNEILTSNELRQIIGYKPSDDPKADKLINSNLNQAKEEEEQPPEDSVINETKLMDENTPKIQEISDQPSSDQSEEENLTVGNIPISEIINKDKKKKGEIQNGL